MAELHNCQRLGIADGGEIVLHSPNLLPSFNKARKFKN